MAAMPAICVNGGTHDNALLVSLPNDVDDLGAADRESQAPAAHAERLAERVGGDRLLEHARQLREASDAGRARPSGRTARR